MTRWMLTFCILAFVGAMNLLVTPTRPAAADDSPFPSGGLHPYTQRYSLWAQRHPDFPVGAWHRGTGLPEDFTAQQRIERYAAAGFTQFMAYNSSDTHTLELRHAHHLLEAERVGLDWQADSIGTSFTNFQNDVNYAMSIGNGPTAIQVFDEPLEDDLPEIAQRMGWARSTYQSNVSVTGVPEPLLYVNLSVSKLDINTLIGHLQSEGVGKPDLLSYTHYPMRRDGTTESDYFKTMAVVRNASLQHNIPVWKFMQAYGRDEAGNDILHRLPSESDIRFQGFTFLGYGGLGIKYFIYLRSDGNQYPEAIIDIVTNQPTEVYYHIQSAMPELRHLGRSLPMLRPVDESVRFVGDVLNDFADIDAFTGRGAFHGITGVDYGAQVSFFQDVLGEEYFMVVNLRHGADMDAQAGEDTIRLLFDVSIAEVQRLNRLTGAVEVLPTMLAASGLQRYLDITLPAGTGDLFKYHTQAPFAMVPEPGTAAVATWAFLLAACRRRKETR